MKRIYRGIVDEEGEVLESVNMANVLMLLSRGAHGDNRRETEAAAHRRVFECKTCSRQFPSFQALGGHRASHKKTRLSDDSNRLSAVATKPKVHECSICGLEFAIGQALGGHMRRHRQGSDGFGPDDGFVEKVKGSGDNGKRVLLLDLNLPPSDDVMEYRKLGIGMEFVEKAHMVDCFQ